MKKELIIPMLGIVAGEAIMYYNKILIPIALSIHMVNLLLMTCIISFSNLTLKQKNVLQSFSLLIILRMINVSLPKFSEISEIFKSYPLLQYTLIYGIMFIPIYLTIKNQHITYDELGLNFKKIYFYIPLAVIIGAIMAMVENQILNPDSSIQKIRLLNLIFLTIVMFMFIAFSEEMIFRSILQTRFEQILGARTSILLSGGIFGIMHSNYGILYEILFTTVVGIIMGYIFYKTQSLPFVVSIHGVTNVVLYGYYK